MTQRVRVEHQAWGERHPLPVEAVDPGALGSLPRVVSSERFDTYRAATVGVGHAVRLYTWNVEISAALWGPLHVLEIATRNAISRELVSGTGADAWWRELELHHPQTAAVERAERAAGEQRSDGSVPPGKVVAELGFAFWIGLLANRYHAALWEPYLHRAFPYRPPQIRRGDIHDTADRLRLLRNRIAHHEPIFQRDLAADHQALETLVGYVDHDAHTWVRSHSRVPLVLTRRQPCERGISATSF